MKRIIAPFSAVLLLGACGADADFNAADIRFARDMIVHHAEAITMVPAESEMETAGAHHEMLGMASAAELAALEKAIGADAGWLFLTLMMRHHEGALTMAEEERENGKNADARALAASIVTAERAEIIEMRRMLG